ncbi:MAG: hypothetical protein IT372_40450 [Polyangiaceae bacterium]|nr:hypothetical protein [Polyangiaceae bacterium]
MAKYASPAEEARYGVSKLDAAITYVEAKQGAPAKGRVPVAFNDLKISIDRDGKTVRLGLDDASVKEIAEATRRLLRAEQKTPAKASPVVTAITRELGKGLLAGITVRLAGGRLALGAIPVEALGDLAKALGRVKLPREDE